MTDKLDIAALIARRDELEAAIQAASGGVAYVAATNAPAPLPPASLAAHIAAAEAKGYQAGVFAAGVACGNSIVEYIKTARPDASPLRIQILRVRMEKAAKDLLPKEPLIDGESTSEPPRDRGKFLPPKDGAPCGGYGGKSQNGGRE